MNPSDAVALDDMIAERVARGVSPPTIRIWQNGCALVLPKRALERLGATRVFDRYGVEWPLCPRSSGGSAVAHGPGTLNISLILPLRGIAKPSICEGYRLWVDLLNTALRDAYGVEVDAARVEGAFCSGGWDVAVGGRKLAGIAQTRRNGSVVTHGTVLVNVDRFEYMRLIEAAENVHYDPACIVSLHELTDPALSPAEVARVIARSAVESRERWRLC
jgi:lipoate-protein ligase A